MPLNLKRNHHSKNLHFLTWSCADRQPLLLQPGAMEVLEAALEKVRRNYDFYITGYVFMPEHVHLLMSEPLHGTLAQAISVLKGGTSMKLKGELKRFWLPRYYDFNVFCGEKLKEKLRYIHRNPVERGLVAAPEEYRWSSFRHYAMGERGVIEVESAWTARWREGQSPGPPIAPKAAR
jgi:putative transposase